MKLRALFPVITLVALMSLSACGFRPLYAEDRSGQSTTTDMSQVEVTLINDRVGQITRNLLIETLTPRGQVANPAYTLDVKVSESTSEQGFTKDNEATIANYLLEATYQLTRKSDATLLRKGTVRSRTSYNIVDSDFASLEAEKAARRDTARNLAQQIANQVAVGLRANP
ncbi:LPS assembly lipoprotein LptE [Thalassospira lucentensis]|uniref:LPS assembly lipoprotein LptE n=1 Tax=Thalassospira lucentensis TaxID=168935 RepID=UPI003AA845A1